MHMSVVVVSLKLTQISQKMNPKIEKIFFGAFSEDVLQNLQRYWYSTTNGYVHLCKPSVLFMGHRQTVHT